MAKVYCFGNTENGELGLGGIEEEHILSPRKQRLPYDRRKYILIDLASGRNHTLLLLKNILHDQNVIFSCGSNERLQLGRVGSWKKLESVNSLTNHSIVKIACGLNHCLALSEAGQIFSWGCNLFGQLGMTHLAKNLTQTLSGFIYLRIWKSRWATNWQAIFSEKTCHQMYCADCLWW